MTSVDYTSDDGQTYRIRMDASNATAAGNPPATSGLRLPGGYEPRVILASHPTSGRERRIVISNPSNAMWVGGDATIVLEDFSTSPSAPITFNVYSRVGEKRYNRG